MLNDWYKYLVSISILIASTESNTFSLYTWLAQFTKHYTAPVRSMCKHKLIFNIGTSTCKQLAENYGSFIQWNMIFPFCVVNDFLLTKFAGFRVKPCRCIWLFIPSVKKKFITFFYWYHDASSKQRKTELCTAQGGCDSEYCTGRTTPFSIKLNKSWFKNRNI